MRLPGNPFLKAGEALAERLMPFFRTGTGNGLSAELQALSGGERGAEEKYLAEKLADCLLVLTVMTVILALTLLTAGPSESEVTALERPGYGMGNREEELEVRIGEESGEAESIPVTVRARRYTEEEEQELLEKALTELEGSIKGENPSLDEVRSPLNMPESYLDGAVKAEWICSPYGILSDRGQITGEPEETGTLVEVAAELTCQEAELEHRFYVHVFPPVLDSRQALLQTVSRALEEADQLDAGGEQMILPESAGDTSLTWYREESSPVPFVLVLFFLLPLCCWAGRDQKVHEKAEERRLLLELDYSELMWKLTMLLGAGVTMRGAFQRISAEYLSERRETAPRYTYEEVYRTCLEMRSGIPEAEAYERFGRRCGLPRYIKLGTLLSQNLKKGSRGLAGILEKEAEISMEERTAMARKLGEQAGTKMIFPMILMLGIVLAILIIPAFLSL